MRLMRYESNLYQVTFTVEDLSLHEEADQCEEYSAAIHGSITVDNADDDGPGPAVLVGEIKAVLFRTRDAINDGVTEYHDIFDRTENSEHLYYAVCTRRGLSKVVRNRFASYPANVLGITFVGVLQDHRGKGVAQAAVKRLCQIFGGDAIVALQSFPMPYPEDAPISVHGGTKEEQAKLLRFWKRCGFRMSPTVWARSSGMELLIADAADLSARRPR